MKFLITLEKTKEGFSVQVPDLAILTYGQDIDDAKLAAIEAIQINLEAYQEAEKDIPIIRSPLNHIENPDFRDVLFAFVDISEPKKKAA